MNTPINLFQEIKEQAEKLNESISKIFAFNTKKKTVNRFNTKKTTEQFLEIFNVTVEGLGAVDPSLKIIFESGNELSVGSFFVGFNEVYFWEWNASKNEEKIKKAKKYGILIDD